MAMAMRMVRVQVMAKPMKMKMPSHCLLWGIPMDAVKSFRL
jgi:hypothetical protein